MLAAQRAVSIFALELSIDDVDTLCFLDLDEESVTRYCEFANRCEKVRQPF